MRGMVRTALGPAIQCTSPVGMAILGVFALALGTGCSQPEPVAPFDTSRLIDTRACFLALEPGDTVDQILGKCGKPLAVSDPLPTIGERWFYGDVDRIRPLQLDIKNGRLVYVALNP